VQRRPILRVAEKLVERLFHLRQCGAQFVHHATHGLAVTDAPVQLLHPGLQRLGLGTAGDVVQALGEPRATLRHLRFGRVEIFVGCLQIQHRGGHFHRHRRTWRFARTRSRLDRPRQRSGQFAALRVQLLHRLGNRRKLVGCLLHATGIAPCKRRPGLGSRCNALARLHQQRGVEAPELWCRIVDRAGLAQAIGQTHCAKDRCP